jgi:hypothetical protein
VYSVTGRPEWGLGNCCAKGQRDVISDKVQVCNGVRLCGRARKPDRGQGLRYRRILLPVHRSDLPAMRAHAES